MVDILIDTQAALQELVVASGLKVLEAMLEEDRAAVCGPRYAHQPARQAYRTGHTPSQVVLGGRKVAIRRPRARRAGEEVPLPTARAFANADPLNRRVVDQLLIGVATRQYARSLEPLGADVTTRGTSTSAVSRRFVAQTQAQLDAWRATPLDALDLVGLLIDGVQCGWCTASGFLDSGLTVFASTPPRPARGGRVAPGPGFGSRTSPASTARCTSA